jgi:hypothetical protein
LDTYSYNLGKNWTILLYKTFVSESVKAFVPKQEGGREEYSKLLLKNIFSSSNDSFTVFFASISA